MQIDRELYEKVIEETILGKPRRFIETFLSVRSKDNLVVPFRFQEFSPIIHQLDTDEGNYAFVLKPRQVGCSTYHLAKAFAFACCIPNFRAAIVSHERESTERLFQTVRNFYDFLPEKIRPKIDQDRTDGISFERLKSRIYIGTAGGRKFGRGETINFLMLSEMAHYQETDAHEIWTGAPEAVPAGGHIIIESTPNGIGNLFHTEYVKASQGQTRYGAHFYPWFHHPEYALAQDAPETLPADRIPDSEIVPTAEELELLTRYNLNVRQLRWRRSKMAEKQHEFPQEYPEDDVSCFLATTRTVFPTVILHQMLQDAREPLETRENRRVQIWKRPHPSHQYAIGADPAEGLKGGDASAAAVLDCATGEVVATLHGQIPVHDFARMVADLGATYNGGLVVLERNNHGHAALLVMDSLAYPRLYRHKDSPAAPGRPGFPTSAASKTQLVGQTRAALEAGDLRIWDRHVIRELVEYQMDERQRYAAPQGGHDDRVMATMLALHGRLADPSLSLTGAAISRRRAVALYPAGL